MKLVFTSPQGKRYVETNNFKRIEGTKEMMIIGRTAPDLTKRPYDVPKEWIKQVKSEMEADGIKCRIKNGCLYRVEPDYVMVNNTPGFEGSNKKIYV